ncbi:MAG: homocysteine S-methyltransferase family protein [Phycisphaerae bacterium]|nr:homocysteine S-methyltransferase family protein [Phycisphaerae bacterium]
MTFTQALQHAPAMLTEGAIIERLRRDSAIKLDPHVLNAGLLYDPAGRRALTNVYRQYLEIGRATDLPMLVCAPTWRANRERQRAAGLADRDVNGDAVRLLRALQAECGPYAGAVHVGGLLGCRGDAYNPAEALDLAAARDFHTPQVQALCAAGVDFLLAATLPAVCEALGLAQALAATGLPYVLSCVVRSTGTWLDGTPIADAIAHIDRAVSPPPSAYFVNCVHPTVFAAALDVATRANPEAARRVVGLQANTSTLSPEALDNRPHLDSAAPERFAADMLAVRLRFGTRVVGGCCGTDDRHLWALAAALR